MNITKSYLTKNPCYQAGRTRTPIGIQIHTIGTAQGTAQSVADYWNQGSVQACVTYVVDSDTAGKVLQLLPEETRSWADAGYGNRNLITIELCESDYMRYSGGASFTITNAEKCKADILRSYQTGVELCIDICRRYKWDPLAKLPSGLYLISSHDEGRRAGLSSSHVDPTHIWGKFALTMDGFRAAVKKGLAGTATTYKAGEKYTLTVDNFIRTDVSGGYVPYADLSDTVKKKVKREGGRVKLKAANTVQALEVKTKADGDVWIRIKSGWICAKHEGRERLKKA